MDSLRCYITRRGTKLWISKQYGHYHREDGPAVERADGDNEWWLHGVQMKDQTEHFMQLLMLLRD